MMGNIFPPPPEKRRGISFPSSKNYGGFSFSLLLKKGAPP